MHTKRMSPGYVLPVLLIFVLLEVPARAETLCGTVTDRIDGSPVEEAGVLVHTMDDVYTGLHGATDALGAFCIDGITPGVYNLEIRRDDYQIEFVTGVVVADDLAGVHLTVMLPAAVLSAPWPNPAPAGIDFRLTVNRSAPLSLRIVDLKGRVLRDWRDDAPETGEAVYSWDGRDRAGRPLPGGMYMIQLRTTEGVSSRPVVLVR